MAITKITTPELFDFSATNTALQLPTGTTAQRPTSPSAGQWRFNTTLKYVEYWDGGAWRQIDTEELPNPDDFPSQNFNVNTYFGTGATRTIDAKFNEAANFNGSSSLITLPDSSVISQQNNFTISFWVKPNGFVSFGTVLTLYSDYRNYVDIRTNGILGFDATGSQVDTPSSSITDGVWQHIAITKSSTAGTVIYVNGTAVATDASDTGNATDFTSNSYPNTMGAYKLTGSASDFFPGSLDQVRIFNTALTSLQVTDLYNNETTTTAATLNFPAGAGCTAAYQLDGDASDVGGTYGGVTTDIGYTGLKFQPDLIWMKRTNTAQEHALVDSVRGIQQEVNSDTTAGNLTTSNGVSSFNTNGWTMGANGLMNNSGDSYVAWSFKAGGTAVTGTSTHYTNPTISANTEAGFSIVKFTIGSGTIPTTASYNHGLSTPPKLIITKPLDGYFSPSEWYSWAEPITTANYLILNTTAQTTAFSVFSSVDSTTVKYRFGSDNAGADTNVVTYNFADIAGYQKVGTYTGDGNTTGNFIYTTSDGTATGTGGFEPAFLMVKRTDGTSAWNIQDNKRNTTNPRTSVLQANSSDQEYTQSNYAVNFFTNGFELNNSDNGWNTGGGTYIYLAIAADKDTSVPTQANSFSPTIYTGNGGTQNVYTPFAPDFTWIKSRTGGGAESHVWNDTIRGISNAIYSNTTGAEYFGSGFYNTSFNPNGFTVGDNSAGNYGVNGSTYDYVSWNWKAGGLPTINNVTGSTITGIVSANVAAGFSIVKYRGNGTAGATVGHGLTSLTPSLIIWKNMSATSNWLVYSPLIGNDSQWLYLNATNEAQTSGSQNEYPTYKTDPTSTLVTVNGAGSSNNINISGENTIMYCFADIAGYQKVGTYSGTGVAGKVVSTGFRPSFVLIKAINYAGFWVLLDDKRTDGIHGKKRLYAQLASLEDSSKDIEFNATNFTIQDGTDDLNGNYNYLYLAIK